MLVLLNTELSEKYTIQVTIKIKKYIKILYIINNNHFQCQYTEMTLIKEMYHTEVKCCSAGNVSTRLTEFSWKYNNTTIQQRTITQLLKSHEVNFGFK